MTLMTEQIASPPVDSYQVKGHPLFGHLGSWLLNGTNYPAEVALANEGIARIKVANRRFLIVARPDVIRHIAVKNRENYRRGSLANALIPEFGETILTVSHEAWLKRRRLLQPSFHHSKLPIFDRASLWAAQVLAYRWQEAAVKGEAVPAVRDLRVALVQAMSKAFYGSEIRKDEAQDLVEAYRDALALAYRRARSFRSFLFRSPPPHRRESEILRERLDELVRPKVSAALASKLSPESSLFASVVETAKKAGLTEEEADDLLFQEIRGLFAAGIETTGDSLPWILYKLAQDKAAAARFYEEADRARNRLLAGHTLFDEIEDYPFTTALIHETLRLYPAVPAVGRVALNDDQIDDIAIVAGEEILISIKAVQKSPLIWDRPESFDPDRWRPNDPRLKNGSWIPFGVGAHLCIGNSVALRSLTTFLLVLGMQFTFTDRNDHQIEPNSKRLSAGPAEEIWLGLT